MRARLAGLSGNSPVFLKFLGRQCADVRLAAHYKLLGKAVQALEIVGRIELAVAPIKPHPMDVLAD